MHKPLLPILVTAAAMFCTLPVGAGEISRHSFVSYVLGRDYAYNIYLPDGYDTREFHYPALYLLHGSFANENEWTTKGGIRRAADRLIRRGVIPPAVIVMPGSENWWVDGYNEAAETAFFEDLIPHVEAMFRIIPERAGRLVGGVSAGGYGTVNFVLEHPDMFAAGAALSPASYVPLPPLSSSAYEHPAYLDESGNFDPQKWQSLNYTAYIEDYQAQDGVVPLHISAGDDDVFDIAYHAAVLHQTLSEHQPDAVELLIVDGGHNWRLWKKTLPEALEYVFSYASVPRGASTGVGAGQPATGRKATCPSRTQRSTPTRLLRASRDRRCCGPDCLCR